VWNRQQDWVEIRKEWDMIDEEAKKSRPPGIRLNLSQDSMEGFVGDDWSSLEMEGECDIEDPSRVSGNGEESWTEDEEEEKVRYHQESVRSEEEAKERWEH
jgi:hypothetical protein